MKYAGKKKATKKKKKKKSKEELLKAKLRKTTWQTSDEDEIARRRLRGIQESFKVQRQDEAGYFSDYLVSSVSGGNYSVEIRSLKEEELVNSCNCTDFAISQLGTCKHIEGVLHSLQKSKKRLFQEVAEQGSERIEIYWQNTEPVNIKIRWPAKVTRTLKQKISPFFSEDGTLLAKPIDGVAALQRTIRSLTPAQKRKVRFSRQISPWLESQIVEQQKRKRKEDFLKDVTSQKKSLDMVKMPLYQYQQQGMLHLAFEERALLADEMGLGKTVQAIAAAELLRRTRAIRRVLVISPTSLKSEWEEQIAKFTDLSSLIILGSRQKRIEQYKQDAFFYLSNYEQIRIDLDKINEILQPDLIILDEAQRVKNWRTTTAMSIKKLKSPFVFVLTGTPIENRIDEIFSIMQVINPNIFGSLFRFNRDFHSFDENGKLIGVKDLHLLNQRLQGVMLRRKKSDVEGELPQRTVNHLFVDMTSEQRSRYDDYEYRMTILANIAMRRPLSKEEMENLQILLGCMRMMCDTPYILDSKIKESPKIDELETILEDIFSEEGNQVIIFSEWVKMLELVEERLEKMEIGYALHTGSVQQKKRREQINLFKKDENCRVFLSSDSGSVGLNLQNANYVINLDLPWNPAKLEQRIARAWRKHQKRSVNIINIVTKNSIEERMIDTLAQKQSIADSALDGSGMQEFSLQSGRKAFLKKLSELTGFTMKIDEKTDVVNHELPVEEVFKQDVLARFPEKVTAMDVYSNDNGQKTVLTVVNDSNPELKEEIEKKFPSNEENIQHKLIDKALLQELNKLAELGIIQFNENVVNLKETEKQEKQTNERKKQILALAKKIFSESEHKRKMATVLHDGGFTKEALPHIHESLEKALKALIVSEGEQKQEPQEALPFSAIEPRVSKELFSILAKLREGYQDLKNDEWAVHAIGEINDFFEKLKVKFLQESLH